MNGNRADLSKTEAIKMEINSEINHAFSFINNKFGSLFKKGDEANSVDVNGKSPSADAKYYTDLLPNGEYQVTVDFLRKLVEKMFENIDKSMNRNEKILTFHYPHELSAKLDLEIPPEPLSLDQILLDCENTMKYSVRTAHPRFFNQISQGLDLVSLAGEWVTAATNTNMFTYEVAPVYNLIEQRTLQKMRSLIGWNEPGDGLFSPGGSVSNLYAIQAAKHYYFPDTKQEGLFNMPKLVIFTSEHSHYSVHKAATILGFGLNQVKNVPVDARGKMRPDELERLILESIERKELPFMVCLTAGTTVLGAFDPIEPASAICKKYNMWLHVDAAWGGGALLSKKHRHLMEGVEKADSVTWNPHKLMGALLQCSAFLIKHTGILQNCNEMNATYLFQQDKHYDMNFDTGDKTIQCGRHVDVFKIWLMWRAKGDSGFEKHVDRLLDLAGVLYQELRRRSNFAIVHENPEFTNVCFWYVPKSIQHMDRNSDEFKLKLHKVAPKIKERMMLKGSLMVGYQPLDDKPNFFRMIVSNAASQLEDIYFMLDEIEELGRDL